MEIKVIFTGLCIFVHLLDQKNPAVVLPDFRVAEAIVDNGKHEIIDKHIGYIEFRTSDIDPDPQYRQPDLVYKVPDREGKTTAKIEYGLVRLNGEAIEVSGIDAAITDPFTADVAQLEADYLLSLTKIDPGFTEPSGPFVGSFGIQSGTVSVYAIDTEYEWFFKPPAKVYLDTPRLVAQEVAVTMKRTKDPLEIKVGNKAIRFTSNAAITRVRVGNATLDDILMLNGRHHDTDYHFANYYKPSNLFYNNVSRLPLPRKQEVKQLKRATIGFGASVRSGNCPPVNYP